MIVNKKYFTEHSRYLGDVIWVFPYGGDYYIYSNMVMRKIEVHGERLNRVMSISRGDLVRAMNLFGIKQLEMVITSDNTLKVTNEGKSSAYIPVRFYDKIPNSILAIIEIYKTSSPIEMDISEIYDYLDMRNDMSTAFTIFNYKDINGDVKVCTMLNNKYSFYVDIADSDKLPQDISMDHNMMDMAIRVTKKSKMLSLNVDKDFILVGLEDGVIFQKNVKSNIEKRYNMIDTIKEKMYNKSELMVLKSSIMDTLPAFVDNMQVFLHNGKLIIKNFTLVIEYNLDVDMKIDTDVPIQVSYDFAKMLTKFKEVTIYSTYYGAGNDMCFIETDTSIYACVIPSIERQQKYEGTI